MPSRRTLIPQRPPDKIREAHRSHCTDKHHGGDLPSDNHPPSGTKAGWVFKRVGRALRSCSRWRRSMG
jgi:hypothetical protein